MLRVRGAHPRSSTASRPSRRAGSTDGDRLLFPAPLDLSWSRTPARAAAPRTKVTRGYSPRVRPSSELPAGESADGRRHDHRPFRGTAGRAGRSEPRAGVPARRSTGRELLGIVAFIGIGTDAGRAEPRPRAEPAARSVPGGFSWLATVTCARSPAFSAIAPVGYWEMTGVDHVQPAGGSGRLSVTLQTYRWML